VDKNHLAFVKSGSSASWPGSGQDGHFLPLAHRKQLGTYLPDFEWLERFIAYPKIDKDFDELDEWLTRDSLQW